MRAARSLLLRAPGRATVGLTRSAVARPVASAGLPCVQQRWLSEKVEAAVSKEEPKVEETKVEKVKAEIATDNYPSYLPGFMRLDRAIGSDDFNRWMAFPPVMLLLSSTGSLYAWSIYNGPLTRELGVISASSMDWALGDVVTIFSATAVVFGVSVGTLGKTIERMGPRASAVIGSVFWGSGLALTGVGAQMHMLPLLYAGYGVCGGLGFAFGYISPLSSVSSWFPERKGLATGIAIGAFGMGPLMCIPLSEHLMAKYRIVPDFLGTKDAVSIIQEGSRQVVEVGGQMKEVVVATADSLKVMPGIVENGVYVVGTGSTGLGYTFLTLSGIYTSCMLVGALGQRFPRSFVENAMGAAKKDAAPAPYVPVETFMTLPQFPLMTVGLMGNAMSGACIIAAAKTIMAETFGPTYPLLVDAAFAGSFVAGLSLANLGGRLFWPGVSDAIGRRNTNITFAVVSVPVLAAMPTINAMTVGGESTMPLYGFIACSSLLVSCYGGLLGILPPYISDLCGAKNATSIYGRVLAGWAVSLFVGPKLMTTLRTASMNEELAKLAATVDEAKFQETFGAPVSQLAELTKANAVTISKLLAICPEGTVNPSYMLYDTTLYSLAGIVGVAAVANALVKPVPAKYFIK